MGTLTANVRMYRLDELGDCFLLTFTDGAKVSRILIDCGSFRNSAKSIARLKKITADIKQELGGAPLSVVVGTHQHNDHVSGFVHCEDIFRQIGVEQVWLSWLDDPNDRKARKIGNDFNNLRKTLFKVRNKLQSMTGMSAGHPSLSALNDALGFFGSKDAAEPPELPADAVKILKDLGKKTLYLNPGQALDMPGLSAGSVKIHVLGPPRNTDLLYRKDPRKGESYDHALASALLAASKFFDASEHQSRGTSAEERQYPFNQAYKRTGNELKSDPLGKLIAGYNSPAEKWRRIDDDWMDQAETLALFLDTYTNNSSLALAIELVESGKVLLFAADAQTGNWISWADVKWDNTRTSTDDLLARTVLYKVGHHGSHNSTLVAAFEKMTHPDLAALIPVHKKDPNITKANGWKMPAKKLFRKLRERTSGRVLQMDGINPAGCNPGKQPALGAWKKIRIKPKQTDMFVELEIPG
ncbi:hypothetical protein LJR220_002210 [Bradyrhizobium sp. LjRoot220]|uniref:hypothetical protein n=1 Tax=Bradyrhizobium sp. LjRoot220 TaxID=3342284 RepID=UPI003ECEE4F3